jgi:hypothetical protein
MRHDVDFAARTVTFVGRHGEEHVEAYPAVAID